MEKYAIDYELVRRLVELGVCTEEEARVVVASGHGEQKVKEAMVKLAQKKEAGNAD